MKKFTLIFCILLFPNFSFSSPLINNVSGTFNHGKDITITGSGFGTKSPAKPLIWMPFERGTIEYDASLSSGAGSVYTYPTDQMQVSSSDLPHSRSSFAVRGIPYIASPYEKRSAAIKFTSPETSKIYMFYRRKYAHSKYFDGQNNYKFMRFNTLYGSGYPNFILSFNNSRSNFTNEGTTPTSAFANSIVAPVNSWFTEEVQLYQGDTDVKNATARYWVNGGAGRSFPGGTFIGRTSANPNLWGIWHIHNNWTAHSPENPPPSGAHVYFDDVYVDITWARVMIGNASTFNTCTHREPLIPTAWSESSITAYFNQGSFPNGSKVYLFVIDSNGNASPGKEIAIGGTASAGDVPKPTANPNPPVNLNIN